MNQLHLFRLGAGIVFLFFITSNTLFGQSATITKTCSGSNDTSCGTGYQCIKKCGPPVVHINEPPPGYICELDKTAKKHRKCPICLASNTLIATPNGLIKVTKIKVGTRVWTLNAQGIKESVKVLKIVETPVPKDHHVVHLVLNDMREIWVSPHHPTSDRRIIRNLRSGDLYGGTQVVSAELVPYWDNVTYDLLPDGETGQYQANGIWLGSTLKKKNFKTP